MNKFDDLQEELRRAKEGGALESVRASTVAMQAIEWLWLNRFALGKVGILAGLPDMGKGQVLCYIAAQLTRREREGWPCNEGTAPQGNVLLLTAEDDPSDTVVPRLKAAGADLERIEIVKMVRNETTGKRRMFSLVTDLELLRKKIIEVGGVILVLIDPITAYLGHGKMDSFRTTDVRAVLAPLVDMAAELKVAVIAIMHFNKKIDVTNALLRLSDSLAFGATARHVYGIVADTENKRRLMVRAKNNLAAEDNNKTLAYHFSNVVVGTDQASGQPISAAYILWEQKYVDVTATEAMAAESQNKSPGAKEAAKNFLLKILADGPMLVIEIEEAAEANKISEATLKRAKDDLHIEAKKDGDGGKKWRWHLPTQTTKEWWK